MFIETQIVGEMCDPIRGRICFTRYYFYKQATALPLLIVFINLSINIRCHRHHTKPGGFACV